MNTRPLTPFESLNLMGLNEAGISSAIIFLTATGLAKSILDATAAVRGFFSDSGFHDYDLQPQGTADKVVRQITVIDRSGPVLARISLYRPETKKGDPRLWIAGLPRWADPGDVLALFFLGREPHAVNLSKTPCAGPGVPESINAFLAPLRLAASDVASELLARLREIAAKGPLPALCQGDTAIGRTLEAALGLAMNPSPRPDYRGIEIKAGRAAIGKQETRATLFACVPDWSLSACKSSAEILGRFGYSRGEDLKLYCTVSAQQPNSQGLHLRVDEAARWLREVAGGNPGQEVAIWQLSHLKKRLAQKHGETFWIKARTERKRDQEWFHLVSATHTRNPNLPQFERLLADGSVTLDHLIKRRADGSVHEKGPLFKIARAKIGELFYSVPSVHPLGG